MTDTNTALAKTLTDGALAERLRTLRSDVRAFGKEQRAAFLAEAADRLLRAMLDNELSVNYSPQAIRDSYDSYDDDDPRRVAVEKASDEDLLDVSYMIVGSDLTWKDFHENIDMCVREKFNIEED